MLSTNFMVAVLFHLLVLAGFVRIVRELVAYRMLLSEGARAFRPVEKASKTRGFSPGSTIPDTIFSTVSS